MSQKRPGENIDELDELEEAKKETKIEEDNPPVEDIEENNDSLSDNNYLTPDEEGSDEEGSKLQVGVSPSMYFTPQSPPQYLQREKKTIVIFISAHGSEEIESPSLGGHVYERFFVEAINTKLLSFVGGPFKLGLMKCIKNQLPIDIFTLYNLREWYKNDPNLDYQFVECARDLKEMYKIVFDIDYDDGTHETGFVIENPPQHERRFFFNPNEHENCKKCWN